MPYTRKEGLPKLLEEINLEYFETAIKWLGNQLTLKKLLQWEHQEM
ncbi:hypothetical protein [Bizionia saleffrena]|nr:hypothetical protein [Bizionia saleffrena]